MAKQTKAQKETVERVMHEFKHGELRIGGKGPKVKTSKQAIAVALQEAGATNQESPAKNRANLHRTKAKEHKGGTAQAEAEGGKKGSKTGGAGKGATKAALYAEAERRDISGRSGMSKGQLEHALAK